MVSWEGEMIGERGGRLEHRRLWQGLSVLCSFVVLLPGFA
jgi:hypothetical protein